jgi:hypothetical protein
VVAGVTRVVSEDDADGNGDGGEAGTVPAVETGE